MKKKYAIIVCMLAVVFNCRAQDTVQYMDSCYLFNERQQYTVFHYPEFYVYRNWDDLCVHSSNLQNISSRYNIPTNHESTMIYGVAITVNAGGDPPIEITESEMTKYPYEVILARIENNNLVILDSTSWDSGKDSRAYFKYSITGDGQLYEHAVPVYEYYFETPHMMSGTFYVGHRRTAGYDVNYWFTTAYSVDSMSSYWIHNEDVNIGGMCDVWGGVFPIIQPNRRCSTPEGAPQLLVYNATNTVRFTLPYSPSDSLLLAICGYGLPMDSATVYPVTDSIMDIVVPDSGRYTARLARVCQRDILVQSNWGDPTTFLIMNNLSIEQSSIPTLEVYPNPTDGTVRIGAEGIREVWCVAADGKRTQLSVKNGQVSLKDYTAGLYMLEIQTDEGLYTAKVVRR